MDTETSSDEQSTSEECTSTDSSSDDEKLETAQICGIRLQLPQGLCERADIFREFFSMQTWNQLSEVHKQHLNNFLPTFPEDEEHERNVTLNKLFAGEVFRFNSPLMEFHEHLRAGHCRPDIARMRMLIKKAERNEAKYRHRLHRDRLNGDVTDSRQRLLNLVRRLPPGVEPRMARLGQNTPSYINPISFRTKRRYFQELALIRDAVEETAYSSDENYPEGPPTALSRKQKRHLNTIKNSVMNGEKIANTLAVRTNHLDLEKYITPCFNPFSITEETYKNMLLCYKKRRIEEESDAEYNYNKLNLLDIINRTDLTLIKKFNFSNPPTLLKHTETKTPARKKVKKEPPPPPPSVSPQLIGKINPFFGHSSNSEMDTDSDTIFDSLNNKHLRPMAKPKKRRRTPQKVVIKTEVKTEPIDVFKTECELTTEKPVYDKITPATFSDLDGIDMMNLPIDLEDSNIDILEEFNTKHELMQDTHASFLSLIRDIICSTDEHRMNIQTLEEHLRGWQDNPISPLNDWFSLSESWVTLLASAVNFLSGNFSEQPEDFVPYIEYKPQIDSYQWIGAGRDSDASLAPLCRYWLQHRAQMRPTLRADRDDDIEISDRAQTPPPPRCPTTWTVRRAAAEDVRRFQEQERRRYASPHKAFTFRCNGYESVVGPVKGIYSSPSTGAQKARGHSMLTADRPNYVTILTLVRDATARLPNGEGTRADIVELLKCSQYISPNAPDNVLQSVVSGALDRMHTQFDPCVKYEPKRKVWIYLHRNRSEEDFERLHQQCQGLNRAGVKKPISKSKPSPRSKPKHDKSKTKVDSERKSIDDNHTPNHKVPQVVKVAEEATTPQPVSPVRKPAAPTPTLQVAPSPEVKPELLTNQRIIAVQKPTSKTKNIVKIITTNQAKSLMVSTSPTIKTNEQRLTPTKQIVQQQQQQINQQLLQTIVAQQKQLLLQKQEKIGGEEPKIIITTQIPTIKRTPMSIQSIVVQSAIPTTTTIVDSNSGQEQEIKVQSKLTPIQQQQILQSLRQKVLPIQQTVINPQFRTVAKQKPTVTQQKQVTAGSSLLGQPRVGGTKTISTTQTPLVAKVLTNAAGQVISVESLLAQQKQHGFPQGATLRISGTKTPNIIQLSAPVQNSTVNQIAQPKLVVATPTTTLATTTVTMSRPGVKSQTKTQTATKLTPKITQQLVNAKFVTQNLTQKVVQPKIVVGQQNQLKIPISTKNIALTSTNAGTIRMVNAGSLNLAQISGKPLLITSKSGAFQSLQGQNIIIQTQANTNAQTQQSLIITNADKVTSSQANQVLLSPPMKVQQAPLIKQPAVTLATQQSLPASPIVLGGQTVRLQTSGATSTHRVVLTSQNQGQIITQQILLPVGFQGTPLNIKTLQGLKVVPIAQTQARGIPGRQVFTRVVNPGNIVRMSQPPDNQDISSNASKPTAD